jgi:O-antigen/teichoic acid export membrane protein
MSAETDAIGVSASLRNVMTGTVAKYTLLAVNLCLGVFLMPFTLRHLGTAEYGLWMLVASMTYYFQLLDLGYGSGVVRHIAEADARGDIDRANRVMSTFVVVYSGLGLAAALGMAAIIVAIIPRFPNLTPDAVKRAQVLLALMGARIAIGFPMTVFGAATTARQRFALNNLVAIGVAIANAVATYVVLSAGYGLIPLVAVTSAVGVASYGAYAWTARRAFPEMRIRPSAFNRSLVREVTTFSIYLFVIDIAIQIGFNLDNLVIGAALGTSAVAVYAVALRIADYQRQMCNQFNGLLFPVVVRFDAAGRGEALRDMLVDGTRIALTLVVGVTLCVIAFGEPLIVQWLGPGFEGSVRPLYVLALTGVVLVGQGPLGNILLGTGRHRLVAIAALAEAVINLALSLLLVRWYGLLGVAVGTALPVFVANLFVLLPAACRQVGISVAELARLVSTAPIVGAVPSVLVAIGLRLSWPPESPAMAVAEGAATSLVYLATVCVFGFDGAVRRRYLDHLRGLLPAAAPRRIRTADA